VVFAQPGVGPGSSERIVWGLRRPGFFNHGEHGEHGEGKGLVISTANGRELRKGGSAFLAGLIGLLVLRVSVVKPPSIVQTFLTTENTENTEGGGTGYFNREWTPMDANRERADDRFPSG